MYKKIKFWYDNGLWSAAQVEQAMQKGLITEAEYKAIIGEPPVKDSEA